MVPGLWAGRALDRALAHSLSRDRGLLAAGGLDPDADARPRGGRPARGGALPPRYFRLFRTWFVFGFPAFAAVLSILWLMIARPQQIW
ncbi:MAG: DUF2269 family protein [Paracoccus aminovorans]|nr:DUF2269 family protein [Paracoccus aminovorans]